jgi:(E)-4-hydroxy-3-methylbut-2-enyl-diphosphate synthase
MNLYAASLTQFKRLPTKEVKIGNLLIGNGHPIRVQTMTTTDTMDTMATVEQTIRCIEAGAELVRITAPSKKEAENLQNIKDELRKRGYTTPLVETRVIMWTRKNLNSLNILMRNMRKK